MFPSTMRPWWNQPVWDTCGCCNDNIQYNKFFGLVNAIFGYQVRSTADLVILEGKGEGGGRWGYV
jgi:hypothetical protein